MKFWSDLSWNEKMAIESGEENPYNYSSGFSFDVKKRVEEGKKKAEEKKSETKEVKHE